MSEDQDPFKEYYEETTGETAKGETAREIIARLEAKVDESVKPKNVTGDASIIRAPINSFIKAMNALIGKVFKEEKEKGTRSDLIITLVVGGLAFTVANVFFLVTKHMQSKMTAEEYEATFLGMFKSAMRDI